MPSKDESQNHFAKRNKAEKIVSCINYAENTKTKIKF